MTHRVHGVMCLVTVKSPVTGGIGDKLNRSGAARVNVHSGLRPIGRWVQLASVRFHDPETVTVNVHGMAVHTQVGNAESHSIILFDNQVFGPRKGPTVEGESIEKYNFKMFAK